MKLVFFVFVVWLSVLNCDAKGSLKVPRKMLGVYTVTYGDKHKYTYTVTKDMVFGSSCCGYSWMIKKSDKPDRFRSADGWFKGEGKNWRKGYTLYFRLTKEGKLEIHYFAKSYKKTYRRMKYYYGKVGIGTKRDYLKRTIGKFRISYGDETHKYTYTVTRKRLYGGKCCYYSWNIKQSDNQNLFPSYNGWFKGVGVNGRKGYYMYLRVNKDGKLEIQYFAKGYKHKYNGLPNYYGSTGIGNMIE